MFFNMYYFFKIIATAHIEPQTAIILSVLKLKLQVSDNILSLDNDLLSHYLDITKVVFL